MCYKAGERCRLSANDARAIGWLRLKRWIIHVATRLFQFSIIDADVMEASRRSHVSGWCLKLSFPLESPFSGQSRRGYVENDAVKQ